MSRSPLRIVFMGTPEFAVPSLAALLASEEQVVAVVSQPDRPKGRGRKLTASPVKRLALDHGLPVLTPSKIKTGEFRQQLADYAPDLIVVAAYGRILPEPLITLPPLGTINVHASLLPKYRGAAPIQWAIINGEVESGVTIMQMDAGLDTGDILLSAAMAVEPEDTAGTLAEKLSRTGGALLVEAVQRLAAGRLTAVAQDDRQATLAPPLTKEQGHIDWHAPAETICCLIRGLDPWPSAYGFLAGKRFRFFSPTPVAMDCRQPPGTVIRAEKGELLIAARQGAVGIGEIQAEGSRRMAIPSFLAGGRIAVGDRFA